MSATSDMIREKFGSSDSKRDEGLTTPKDIVRYDNILYGENRKWQILDVYRPENADGKELPIIVSVHGGAWVYGDKERYQYYCMSLAQRGFAVVNFTYRLAPEFKYPAPLEDINLVFNWIFNNKNKYAFDTKHIFAVGDSAGANHLGLYAAICTNPEYQKNYAFEVPNKFVPNAIALNCGVYQIDVNNDELTKLLMADYLPNAGTKDELELLCITNYITETYPPTFYMTSSEDFLNQQALILGQKLVEKKISHEFHFYGNAKYGLGHVFHCNIKLDAAKICNQEECDYFKKFL